MSLRIRMGVAAGIAVAIAVIAVTVSAYAGTRSQLRNQVDTSLRTLSAQAIAGPRGPGGPEASPHGRTQPGGGQQNRAGGGQQNTGNGEGTCEGDEGLGLDRLSGPAFGGAPGIYTLFNRCGGTFVPTGQGYNIPSNSRIQTLARSGHGRYLTDMTVSGTPIRVLVTGIGNGGALGVALPLKDVNHTLSSQLTLLVVIATAGVALAALLGFLVARTALAPIERFTRRTEAIANRPERTEQRLEVVGRDELARLARTFNRTLDALETSVDAQRQLVADASHELRTPIATIRANLQLMRDEDRLSQEDREALRADVIDELDELTALVGDIVELARGAAPAGEPGDVVLDAIVVEALQRLGRRAPELELRTSLEPTLVRGEEDRIARAVTNVLDNARKWSAPDGVVEVDLHDGVLTVRDHGQGFHEEDLPFVFDRFHRAKDARSMPGSGLGLAIVRETAQAHGGFVQAANAPGGGAIVRVGFGQVPAPGDDAPEASLSVQS